MKLGGGDVLALTAGPAGFRNSAWGQQELSVTIATLRGVTAPQEASVLMAPPPLRHTNFIYS